MLNNKKYRSILKRSIWIILVTLVTIILNSNYVNAKDSEPELVKGWATAYNGPTDTTCTGIKCREGICGACKEYLGKVVVLYQRLPGDKVGKVIGIYECLDTGTGTKSFQEGKVIDVWQPDDKAIQDFADLIWEDGCEGKVFIQVIDGVG